MLHGIMYPDPASHNRTIAGFPPPAFTLCSTRPPGLNINIARNAPLRCTALQLGFGLVGFSRRCPLPSNRSFSASSSSMNS